MSRVDGIDGAAESQGLSWEEKRQFILGALPAMANHTFDCICSVYGISDPFTGRHCGSALRCQLDGRRAILTALHVLDEARKEPYGIAISTGYGKLPFVVHGPVHIHPRGDVAVYFLPDDYPSSNEGFWPPGRIDRTPDKLATDYLFLHGYPGKTSYSSQLLGGVVSKSLPYGAMQRLENLPGNLKPFQFAVEYDPEGMVNQTGLAQELVDPHGLSGSPVWRIGVSGRSSRDWNPNDSLLVGTLTQWCPDEKVLIATSTEVLPPSW